MKRIIALVLAFVLLLSLAACSNGSTPETTEKEKVKTDVAEPLTWEKINALPIANDSMTEDELRKLCLDYMYLQLTFAWTPSQELTYNNAGSNVDFIPGKVYGGTPYDNGSYGNLYTVMEMYDSENGMMDFSKGEYTLKRIANQCSSACCWGWGRVANSLENVGATDSSEANGYLRLGNYTYDTTQKDLKGMTTNAVCVANGVNVMYEAYALLKPADGLITANATNGHVRMTSSKATVVRDADNKINGDQSYVTYVDQGRAWWTSTQSNGIPYEIQGGVDVKVTFNDLFKSGYIPVTIAEFNKQKPVDKSVTTISVSGDSVTVAQLKRATITSNYWLSDVTVTITDPNGKELLRTNTPCFIDDKCKEIASSVVLGHSLPDYADGKNKIEIKVRISTGEQPVVYSGILNK